MVPWLQDLSYGQWLRELELPTLAYRRATGNMTETSKIIKGYYHVKLSQDMFERSQDAITWEHSYKLFQKHSRLEIHRNTFLFGLWNALYPNVMKANSINTFKWRLDRSWVDIKLKYNYTATLPTSQAQQHSVIINQELEAQAPQKPM